MQGGSVSLCPVPLVLTRVRYKPRAVWRPHIEPSQKTPTSHDGIIVVQTTAKTLNHLFPRISFVLHLALTLVKGGNVITGLSLMDKSAALGW